MILGDYVFNYYRQTLLFKGRDTTILTNLEADLLYHLYLNRNKVLDRSLILRKLWGDDDFFSARSMDVFISKLRKKLSKDQKYRDHQRARVRLQTGLLR